MTNLIMASESEPVSELVSWYWYTVILTHCPELWSTGNQNQWNHVSMFMKKSRTFDCMKGKPTFVVHVPVVLPDGVIVGAGRRPDGEVGGDAAHNWPLRLRRGSPASWRADWTPRAKGPERRVVEVIDRTDQWAHLYGVDFLLVGFEALGQAVAVVVK